VVKAARRQTAASGPATIGAESYLLGAARMTALSDQDAVLVLGRRAPPPPASAAPATRDQRPPPLPWAAAGAIALVGVGLVVSGRRKTAGAPAATGPATDAAVIPILHETTLKFGEPREPHNDMG